MRILLAAALSLISVGCFAAPLPPDAFRAVNGLWVLPQTPRNFYVPWRGSQGGDTAFFCAAAEYVTRRLALPGRTPIFRLSEPPRKAGQGILFSLDSAGAASRTGITTLLRSGPENSFTANSGQSFCDRSFYR